MTDFLKFFAGKVFHIEIWSVDIKTRLFVSCQSYLKLASCLIEFGQDLRSYRWLASLYFDELFAKLFNEILRRSVIQVLTAKMVITIDSYSP